MLSHLSDGLVNLLNEGAPAFVVSRPSSRMALAGEARKDASGLDDASATEATLQNGDPGEIVLQYVAELCSGGTAP
ncbi:hypothetical protein C7450_107146 [Chelatococcus asaccharovorans]|uniref:Uncharacterized protein n=1 Tax=Chelatococcus asaccharovorans TaxID=28210 RepID=A0A2V3U491_9HYPH|nr:hypothetical protein C7450_107146 [Chelatococcus asaccharovorans]